jgi:2,3-bisphosphoglycerate-dependent phosphoglycerate mutase
MKTYYLIGLLMLTQLLMAQNKTTTYYFIRHAEKVDDSKNPDLSSIGHERALSWSSIFSDINFDAIYSTNFNRTMQTAMAISSIKNVAITKYDPKTIDIQKFKDQNLGKNILIVGHSNSTPDFVNKIINQKKYALIDEKTFGNLYIVTISGEIITYQLLKLP